MPYIKPRERLKFDDDSNGELAQQAANLIDGPGDFNYFVSRVLHFYIQRVGLCYATINACIGIVECIKLELYRRLAGPYEDKKISENGDVY